MRKILLIIPEGKGTIASVSYNLYKSLIESLLFDVYVVNLNYESDDKYKFEKVFNLKRKKRNNIFSNICNYFAIILKLTIIKWKVNPDFSISTLNACTSFNILSFGKGKKIGIFHAPLKQNEILGKFVYFLSLLSYRLLYSRLDRIFCVSEEIRNDIIKNIPKIRKEKIFVVYNIHDVGKIKSLAKEPIEEKYGEIFEKDVVLYVGNLYSIKAPDRLLRSYVNLKKRYNHPINLVFVGKDQYNTMTNLQKLIKHFKIEEHVYFLGDRINPYKYMNKAKFIVSSSLSEGLPGVIIEALILNKPVIATNSSMGIWEIFSCVNMYNKNLDKLFFANKGVICPNNIKDTSSISYNITSDEVCLSNAMEMLLTDFDLYNSMIYNDFNFQTNINSIDYSLFDF